MAESRRAEVTVTRAEHDAIRRIAQIFYRPHTANDNAEIESFFATLKCERLYPGSYGKGQDLQADVDIAVPMMTIGGKNSE